MAKLKLRIKVVRIMAFPLWLITWSMLSSKLMVFMASKYLLKKWMVSSTAIPKITEAEMATPMSMLIPK